MSLNPSHDLRVFTEQVKQLIDEVLKRLVHIEGKVKKLPTRQQLDAAKADLRQAIEDEAAQVAAKIQELIDQVNNGTPATEEDLQELLDDANRVRGILPDQTP